MTVQRFWGQRRRWLHASSLTEEETLKLPDPLKLKKFTVYWLPVLVYCLLIFIQSSFPSPVKEPDIAHFDKYLHLLGYGLLGVLFSRAYHGSSRWSDGKLWHLAFVSILSAGLYGISDEIHQYFVPGRSADALDAAADFIGAALGAFFFLAFFAKRTLRWP